ncbi:sialic acid-binding Ig-like lectin 11, partial [Micropterus dolomieu]|uniref:sialic acid-binding Ig-like lectin 11 n=1 Tax=Micropterus dolomieu TaxID=147949 RepID=UPI001E8D3834
SHITGNITAFKTENLTAVTQRHSSTLMFNSSAEHHGTNVTCRVRFTNNITTEETVTLNVTYVKEVKITGKTRVKEGETLNLTCSVESFPPSLITWTIYSDKYKQNGTETTQQNDTETYLQEESGIGTFSIANMTAEDSGQYTCTAKHLNNTLIQNVDVTVMYMKKPVITGNTIVKEGDALNLTCSVESFPLSHITWTVLGSNTHLRNGPETGLQNDTGSATLVIHNVTVEHSGQYICTAKHLDTTLTVNADITVTLFPKILNSSGCRNQSEVLTCMCISEGFPLPTIKWPLLKDHTEYSVITTVSKHTVNSTITLKSNDHNSTVVQCVSSNEASREAKENFTIRINASEQEDQSSKLLKMVSWLKIIIAFLIGVLFSAALCSLAKKCQRKKQSSVNLDETLEMMTSQEDPLIDPCQALEDDLTYYQEAAEVGEDVTAEKAAPDLDGGAKDVEYASINFSVLKRKSPWEATKKQETTETEYAEIKKQVKEDSKDDNREEGEVFEDKEEEAMIVEDEESKHCVSEDEDVAVYSNVKDIMGEI